MDFYFVTGICLFQDVENKGNEKVKIMELIAKELANPDRDCKRFDPGKK
jgi:hypothetical protein